MNILMLFLGLFELSSYISIGTGDELIDLKISQGFDAKRGESKFMVSLRLKDLEEEYYFGAGHICGGSLVMPNKVLTAVHCLQDSDTNEWFPAKTLVAVLGILKRKEKDSSASVHDIGHYIAHRDHDYEENINDIALLFIKPSVDSKNPNIETIPLPQYDAKIGSKCKAIGWGWIKDPEYPEENLKADHLQAATLQIVLLPDCNRFGRLCAKDPSGQQGACPGDFGAPLINNGVLVGVFSGAFNTSDGKKCFSGQRAIYTDVYYYRSWLNDAASELDKLSFATKSFNFLHATLILLEILLYILI